MVMDGGGRGAVALATPQQPGSTPLLVKYPYLQGICSYLDDLRGGKGLFLLDLDVRNRFSFSCSLFVLP